MRKSTLLLVLAAVVIGLVAVVTVVPLNDNKGKINVLNFGDYIGPKTNAEFENESGVAVNYGMYGTNEELFAKLAAAPATFDVVVPSDYMVKRLIEQGMLEKIDVSKLTNLDNLDTKFQPGHLPFDPKGEYAVAYHYGICIIGYNSEKVSQPITSFSDLTRPSLRGRVTVLDDMRYVMGAALLTLGYSPNSTDTQELDKALTLLKEIRPNLRNFDSMTYHDQLASEQVDVAFGYNVGIVGAAKRNSKIKYVILSEGSLLWTDSLVIPKNAPNYENALKYINFILDKNQGAAITDAVFTATPNKAARELISSALRNDRAVFPGEEEMAKARYIEPIGEVIRDYESRWAELKK